MNAFDKNIAALKDNRQQFYESIKEDIDNFDFEADGNYQILEARNKSMYSQYQREDNIVRFNSNYNPEREAASWGGQYEFPDYNTTVVMFGIAGGYFAKELAKKINDTSVIILIEPEKDVFIKSLYGYDMTELINHDKIVFLIGEAQNVSAVLNRFVYWTNMDYMKIIAHPGYEEAYKEQWKEFVDSIDNYIISMKVERNTEHYFGKKFAFNTIENIKHVQDSLYITDFKNKFQEDTVGIVVAAGPSLDNNIAVLHKLKGKAIIFATDTALRRLYKEGITPDFIITVDPAKDVELFKSVSYDDVPVICKMVSNPEVLNIQKGKKIWINPAELEYMLFSKLGVKMESFGSGGSVATAAFSLCRYIGLKRIVLIGQDLAFKGESSHAGGELRRAAGGNNNECYVKGNNGEMIKSRTDWVVYLKWYEETLKSLPEDVEVINATEGGAYIEGMKIMTLEDVYGKYCKDCEGIDKVLEDILSCRHDNQSEVIEEFMNECKRDIHKIIKDMEKAITLCNRFERKYIKARSLTPQVTDCMKDISRISKRVREYPIYYTVDNIVKHDDVDTIKTIYEKKENEFDENMDMIKKSKRIFGLTLEAAKELINHFENAIG